MHGRGLRTSLSRVPGALPGLMTFQVVVSSVRGMSETDCGLLEILEKLGKLVRWG